MPSGFSFFSGAAVAIASMIGLDFLKTPTLRVALVADATVTEAGETNKYPADRYILDPQVARMAIEGMKLGSDDILNGRVSPGGEITFGAVYSVEVSKKNSLGRSRIHQRVLDPVKQRLSSGELMALIDLVTKA